MSEEVAQAIHDLDYWQRRAEQAEAEVKALRSLEQLDQALSAMSVAEIDSARARIDSALVPQLAKMLALCLIKDNGELYNVVTWGLGSCEPLGEMELILQRTEGKTPTQLRIEAEADVTALQQLIQRYLDDVTISPLELNEGLRAHPGAALLAELDMARKVVEQARVGWTEQLEQAIAAYDAAVKASA
jgi:hypothetical protein